MGPYDVLPVPQDLPEQGSPSRPVFKQRNGSSVIYFIEDSWVVGTTAGSFEGVSFFAQDTALSPCDVATEWYELGPEGAISNPSLLVQPLSSSAAAQLLQLAAEQATSIGAIRHMMVPHAQQLDTVPADKDVAALTDDMRVLRSLLGADAASDFDDEAWRRVAEAHRRVLLELFLALGAAQRSFAVDQRLPIAHGRALLLLTSLVEDAKGCPGREGLYTVLKFISKKEQLPPVARLISETQGVPVFAQQRLLTRQCQAIERALSSTIAVISTLLILRHRDAQTATAATTTLVRDSAPGAVPSQKAIQRAINKALEAAGGGVGGGGGGAAFLAAIRPAAEHMHVYDKHPALLLASRAFYTPGWATAPSRAVAGCVYEAVADDAYDAVHKLLPKSKANQQAAKTLVPFLEIPARHCMAVEEGGGGAQAGRGKSTGIGELLDRILALPGGQGPDLLRALLLWALELSRESMVRPGALPAMHPAITSSQTAVDLLANHKVCVEGKKKDRELLSGDLCLVGRLSLLLARASVAAGPEPGGGEDQGGERALAEARKEKEGAELAGLVNGVLIATWLRHSPGLRPSWTKHTRSLAGGNIKQLVRATFVQLAAEVAPEVLAADDGVGSPAVSEASRGRAAAGGGAAAMGAAAVKRAKRKSKKRRRQAWSTRAGGGAGERAAVCETDSDGRGVGAAGVDGGGVGLRDPAMTLGDFQEQVQRELLKWRQPHLLLLYLDIHRRDPHVGGLWVRVLRALWGISGESVQHIRMHDVRNARHFAALRADVVARWQGGDGPGFSDTEAFFMMGHDAQTCMQVRKKNQATNRALLAYIAQGNTRLLGVRAAAEPRPAGAVCGGRFEARAVARLLLCAETSATVLLVDKPYDEAGGVPCAAVREEIQGQAQALATLLDVPLFTHLDFAPPPPGGGGASPVWRLVEVDGAAEYVWREGDTGYGVQQRGSERTVVVAFVRPR